MRLGALVRDAVRAVAQPRAYTAAQATMPQADGKPAVYGGGVEDEAMMTMGLVGYGGMEGDGEYVTTLGFYGATVVTAGETLATLGMAADDGTEAGGAYLTTLGAAE